MSGNHPGDITLATGLSLGETVEAHLSVKDDSEVPQGRQPKEIKCVYLCIYVDLALAKISLSNSHRHKLNYNVTVTVTTKVY